MRSKQAMKNMAANFVLQIITFLSGIILPRFFLEAYGSSINGMITSIDQFLIYLSLAEAGIGTASVVALYKPLADKDKNEINSVLSATRQFYNKSGFLFLGLVAIMVVVYPYMLTQQVSAAMVRSMILVLAGTTVIDFFFLGKYKVYLTAKQQGYIVVVIQSVGTIINIGIVVLLIYKGFPPFIVKATAPVIYFARFILVRLYIKKSFPELDFHAKPDIKALGQRKAALIHQVVGIIVNNTDVVLLTALLGSRSLLEVSVYSIYNMVVYAVNLFFSSFSNGLTAGFGEVISKKEQKVLAESFSSYEHIYFVVLFVFCTCMGVLLLPFITVYTAGIEDVQYYRPLVAVLFTLIVFMQNVRVPGITMISAAGHFEETKLPAMLEAGINIVVSLALIWKFGMAGVLFGTVCSYSYRSTQTLWYTNKYLVKGSGKATCSRLARNLLLAVVICTAGAYLIPQKMESFFQWILWGGGTFAGICVCFGVLNFLCEPKEFTKIFVRIKKNVK